MLPFLLIIFFNLTTLFVKKSSIADKRVKLSSEILQGIRILKFYCTRVESPTRCAALDTHTPAHSHAHPRTHALTRSLVHSHTLTHAR